MRRRSTIVLGAAGLLLTCWGVLQAQKPFREYPAIEYIDFELPPDYKTPRDFTWARLKYSDPYGPNLYWSMDYPRSDRHVVTGIRRLTRVDVRSVEQVVEADGSDDIFNWPFLYAVEAGRWVLKDEESAQLRDFLQRGGFLMSDDFHGELEWRLFEDGIKEILPDAIVEELKDDNTVFHTVYDLSQRVQVPGWGAARAGYTYEREDGKVAHWRGIHDARGRLIAVFCHNMDLGDAWEHSDDPRYPENMASVAYRVAMNYILYDLTH